MTGILLSEILYTKINTLKTTIRKHRQEMTPMTSLDIKILLASSNVRSIDLNQTVVVEYENVLENPRMNHKATCFKLGDVSYTDVRKLDRLKLSH